MAPLKRAHQDLTALCTTWIDTHPKLSERYPLQTHGGNSAIRLQRDVEGIYRLATGDFFPYTNASTGKSLEWYQRCLKWTTENAQSVIAFLVNGFEKRPVVVSTEKTEAEFKEVKDITVREDGHLVGNLPLIFNPETEKWQPQ